MKTTVAHRCDTVAMKCHTATVAGLYETRTYTPTVAHRCTLPHSRARTGARAHAHARGNILRAMGTVATVCDGGGYSGQTRHVCARSNIFSQVEQGYGLAPARHHVADHQTGQDGQDWATYVNGSFPTTYAEDRDGNSRASSFCLFST